MGFVKLQIFIVFNQYQLDGASLILWDKVDLQTMFCYPISTLLHRALLVWSNETIVEIESVGHVGVSNQMSNVLQ